MKFTTAWADVLSQNVTLKAVIGLLSLIAISMTVVTGNLALKDPLIIERECFSTTRTLTEVKDHTHSEIEAFVKVALSQRFDSKVIASNEFLSDEERSFKTQETKDFEQRSISQRIIVNSVQPNGNTIKVDADRLLSIGSIRSALSFPLTLIVSKTTRTQNNPYGLKVLKVSSSQKKDGEK